MKPLYAAVLAALVAAPPVAQAQATQTSSQVSTSPGSAKAVQTMRTTATLVGIDPVTRTVSLKRADGRVVDIHAGDEVRNFDKLKVGDKVTAEYTQALSLDLKKGAVGAARRSESVEVNRAAPGAQPGATVGSKVTILADVIAVNKKDQSITLRGPQGHVVELKVQDPEQLKRVKAGDQVEAVYTEALAIAVQPASTAPGK
jgi:Cu/Ag efflux protein CusF